MRSARAAVIVASVALAATACGGKSLPVATPTGTVVAPGAAVTAAVPAVPSGTAAPSDAAPTDTDPASPTATGPADGATPTADAGDAAGPADPTLLTAAELPAGYTQVAVDPTVPSAPGICNALNELGALATSVSRSQFVMGSAGIKEVDYTYPDAATADSNLADEKQLDSCPSFDQDGGHAVVTPLTPDKSGDSIYGVHIVDTMGAQTVTFDGGFFTEGAHLYEIAYVSPPPFDSSVIETISSAAVMKARAGG